MHPWLSALHALVHHWAAARSPARRRAVRRTTAALCALTAQLPTDTRRVVTPGEIAARLQLSERAVEHHLVTAALAFAGCSTPHRIDASDSAEDRAASSDEVAALPPRTSQ